MCDKLIRPDISRLTEKGDIDVEICSSVIRVVVAESFTRGPYDICNVFFVTGLNKFRWAVGLWQSNDVVGIFMSEYLHYVHHIKPHFFARFGMGNEPITQELELHFSLPVTNGLGKPELVRNENQA